MTLIQYITRKRKKENPTWQDINELTQAKEKMLLEIYESGDGDNYYKYTLEKIKYNNEKIGVMVASTDEEDNPGVILIGWSLCNKVDIFDHRLVKFDNGIVPIDYGLNGTLESQVFVPIYDPGFSKRIASTRAAKWAKAEGSKVIDYVKAVPDSIKKDLAMFIERAIKYYKGDKLPEWADLFLRIYNDKRRNR